MLGLSRIRRLSGLAVVGCLVSIQMANGQDKIKSDKVNFETGDGVKIVGSYWASQKGKKAPVVLLLHDFKHGKGGNSHADGWDALAESLAKDGYAVLSFDFRGHGDSTTVNAPFWMQQHNLRGQTKQPNLAKPPETISHSGFNAAYYPHFINDIAAAKAFLDRKNDGGELNSSNLIVIGAGEGATLGAVWMHSEWVKARANIQVGMIGAPKLSDMEGKDQVCAIWLDISPTLSGSQMYVSKWLVDVGKTHKIPMGFIYGKEAPNSRDLAARYLTAIVPNFKRGVVSKEPGFEFTNEKDLPTKLTGSQLLNNKLPETEKFIVEYLRAVMDKHQITEWRNKDSQMSTQFWVFPNAPVYKAKNENELAPLPIPVERFTK